MSTDDYTIRQYRPGDEANIVQLLQLVFQGWPKMDLNCTPLEHWRWKCLDNPSERNCILLGISDEKIIGVMHSLSYKIKIGDECYLCHYVGDTAVHPDFRRMGITKKMIDFGIDFRKKEGIKLAYFVTSNPVVVKMNLRLGLAKVFPYPITNLVRIRDIDLQMEKMPIRNAWLMKMAFHSAKLINELRIAIRKEESINGDFDIVRVEKFDERMDEFWEEISKNHRFIVEKRMGYLNWRYCDPRGGGFVVKQAVGDGRVLGYIVLRVNLYREDYPIGYIVDLLALPDRVDVAEALVADAVSYFDSNNINIVNYQTVRGHAYVGVLRRHGFLDSHVKIYLFYWSYGLEEELEALKKGSGKNVYFSYGDIDSLPSSIPQAR